MLNGIQHHISWETASGRYTFRVFNGFGSMTTSDGQVVELPMQDWIGVSEAVRYLTPAKEPQKSKKDGLPANAGEPWDAEQEQRLVERFAATQKISNLAREFGRTPGAIKARLQKLGLVD